MTLFKKERKAGAADGEEVTSCSFTAAVARLYFNMGSQVQDMCGIQVISKFETHCC